MNAASHRTHTWVFYTAAGLLFAGVLLRAVLVVEGAAALVGVLLLLLGWLALFVSEPALRRRWAPWSIVYLALQTAAVVGMLLLPGDDDFYVVLCAVLSMQALQRFGVWPGVLWLGLFALAMLTLFLASYSPAETVALTLAYTAVNLLLGSFALATRRAEEARNENLALGRDLGAANAELRAYSDRLERLAVARERNRMARELHDSVTQTVFSMTLAGQAAILVQDEPSKLDAQLERLRELAESALAEMRTLVSELRPDAMEGEGLVEAIRRDIDRRRADGVTVSLRIHGPGAGEGGSANGLAPVLLAAEEATLLRIAQEALNNVVKHSGATEAEIHLGLGDHPSLEVSDSGMGFEPERAGAGSGMGLAGMRERATEIGWTVEVTSEPGAGTRVLVQRMAHEGGEI